MNPTKKSQQLETDESSDLFEQQLAELVSELTDRAQRGEQVDLEKVCQQHPQFAHELSPKRSVAERTGKRLKPIAIPRYGHRSFLFAWAITNC